MENENVLKYFLGPEDKVIRAIEIIESCDDKIAIVVDQDQKLLGVITDGDIRRGFLRGITISDLAVNVMSVDPVVANKEDLKKSRDGLKEIIERKGVLQLPVIDNNKRVIGLINPKKFIHTNKKNNTILIMAGGYGRRLGDLTKETPKPMLELDGKPILLRIIEKFKAHGFENFVISVFFKAEVIKNYFKDGSSIGVNIAYSDELQELGTAGSLNYLKNQSEPILMINGDILTSANFDSLLNYHNEQQAKITVCGTRYEYQIPYGVIEYDGAEIKSISEKPLHRFYVNSGIYVIDPECINYISSLKKVDMNHFVEAVIANKERVIMYPLHEIWIDIGNRDQFLQAQEISKTLYQIAK